MTKMATITISPSIIQQIKEKISSEDSLEETLTIYALNAANLSPSFDEVPSKIIKDIQNRRYKIRWNGNVATVVVPVFSPTVTYTCGICGRGVYMTPVKGDNIGEVRIGSNAIYCAKCDDIFCITCGREKMTKGGNVPCGNCGGDARTIDDKHHPSWYPGKRPKSKKRHNNHFFHRQEVVRCQTRVNIKPKR